jgi:DNA polymerase III epsilon subunit-like protein
MALIIDTETTGFPDSTGLNLKWGYYPEFNNLTRYDSSRIISFCWMLINEENEEIEKHYFIIKSDGFKILNTSLHGLTDEILDKEGKYFVEVANNFYQSLKKTSHIIGHNLNFDINVLKSELFRYNLQHIITEIEKKSNICSMEYTKMMVNIKIGKNIKSPKLNELYEFVFKVKMENAHSALYDVINLHKIIKSLYDNKKWKILYKFTNIEDKNTE